MQRKFAKLCEHPRIGLLTIYCNYILPPKWKAVGEGIIRNLYGFTISYLH